MKYLEDKELLFWSPEERHLREKLEALREDHGCWALKFETEAEGASFEQIRYNMNLALGELPVIVKIGGPEARNDISELLKIGVNGLIAPMVESPYGLTNFITALRQVARKEQYDYIFKGFNVETITTFRQLDEIFSLPEIKEINSISIGRSDLAGSLSARVDDPEVMKIVREIRDKAKSIDLDVSVGGGITPSNAERIVTEIKPDKINTRNLGFSLKKCPDIKEAIREALKFEIALLEHEASQINNTYQKIKGRAETLRERMRQ